MPRGRPKKLPYTVQKKTRRQRYELDALRFAGQLLWLVTKVSLTIVVAVVAVLFALVAEMARAAN